METKSNASMNPSPSTAGKQVAGQPHVDTAAQTLAESAQILRALARLCDKYGLPHDVDALERHLVSSAMANQAMNMRTIKLLASKLDMMRVEIDVLPHTEFGTPGCSSNYERERQCDSNFCHCNCYKSKLLATPHRCSVPDTLRVDAKTKVWPYVD